MLAETFTEPQPIASMGDLLQRLSEPNAWLWTGERSTVFVTLSEFNGERVVEAAPAAGDLEEIITLGAQEIEQGARQMGATQVHVRAGRGGWVKPLQAIGYEQTAIVMRKIL